MTEELLYSVWLQNVLGAGADFSGLLGLYGTPKTVYEQSAAELRLSGALLPSQLKRFSSCRIEKAYASLKRCEELGVRAIYYDDEDYPALLREIKNPPLVLYVSGDVSVLNDNLCISIVGSRSASKYSLRIAQIIASDMARAGVTVVSGGALGVDSASHEGALSVNGKTVAVLGCGMNSGYLKTNEDLRKRIALSGAVISEYSPDAPAASKNFPIRNRIISGLSRGTLVIEAGEKSGSLITAKDALEQNRDVFAVPGDITSIDYTGVNKLIRDGAKPVFSAHDVLSEYMWLYDIGEITDMNIAQKIMTLAKPEKKPQEKIPDLPKEKRPIFDGASENTKKVYDVISDKPLYTDEIISLTKLEAKCVFTALTELEIYGLIKTTEGKRYITV